jgi:hypothetical protein
MRLHGEVDGGLRLHQSGRCTQEKARDRGVVAGFFRTRSLRAGDERWALPSAFGTTVETWWLVMDGRRVSTSLRYA